MYSASFCCLQEPWLCEILGSDILMGWPVGNIDQIVYRQQDSICNISYDLGYMSIIVVWMKCVGCFITDCLVQIRLKDIITNISVNILKCKLFRNKYIYIMNHRDVYHIYLIYWHNSISHINDSFFKSFCQKLKHLKMHFHVGEIVTDSINFLNNLFKSIHVFTYYQQNNIPVDAK